MTSHRAFYIEGDPSRQAANCNKKRKASGSTVGAVAQPAQCRGTGKHLW
jgi:hypothetical protein